MALLVAMGIALIGVLLVASWVVAVVWPSWQVRSLIGFDGIRWLVGGFTESVNSPLLVWLLVWSVAMGTLRESGLLSLIMRRLHGMAIGYRERIALWVSIGEAVLFLALFFLLAFAPHALLRNVVGGLLPSAFSRGVVPAMAFVVTVSSLSYGWLSGTCMSVVDAFRWMKQGVERAAAWLVVYLVWIQVVEAVKFVLYT